MTNYILTPLCILLLLLSTRSVAEAQTNENKSTSDLLYVTEKDKQIFEEYITNFIPKQSLELGNLIVETARYFEGCPYVAHTLEKSPEGLVVNLQAFDCQSFVETTLALCRTLKTKEEPSFEEFCSQLKKIRFRGEKIESYTDRIHYVSDWIFENEKKGLVKNITEEIGGEKYDFNIYFMSKKPEKYEALVKNPSLIPLIEKKEKEISARRNHRIIPEDRIEECTPKMKDGDIVAFVTNIEGLDVSHVGIVCKKKEKTSFVHASSSFKQVALQHSSIQEYTKGAKHNIGIMVVRPM